MEYTQDVEMSIYALSVPRKGRNIYGISGVRTQKGEKMDDLISRQALLEEYDRLHVGKPGRARKMIEDAPSVQPKIIRCKDCIYYRQEIDMCDEPYSTAHNVVREDDYCSRAERSPNGFDRKTNGD